MLLPKTNVANRFSLLVFLFICLAFVFVKIRQVRSVPYIKESYALSWDNYGYYLHLPAIVLHGDPGMEDRSWLDSLNNKYQQGRPFYQAWAGQHNRLVNVYPVGLAVCYLPFFLAGHAIAKISGYPPDGLSPPYQWAMIISALFYGMLGVWLLRKLLLRYFNDRLTAALLLLIAFGTNLYYYATHECNLPHIFLFALDTWLILLVISWHERPKGKTALLIGLVLGLVTITRPSEIVWLLVPLFWNVGSWKSLKEKMKLLGQKWHHVLLLVGGMIAVGSLQLFYWKYTSGHWFSFNHTEGFDFFHPFTGKVLFSYKKGWLLYTPVMIFAITGLFLLFKKDRKLFVPFFLFFLANLWFISSWECWWYAGTFGQRPFVQSYGLMAIPLGVFIATTFAVPVLRYVTGAMLVFSLFLNQFQTWQINHSILDRERMTESYYWKVFGKTSVQPEWMKLLEIDHGNIPPMETVMNDYTSQQVMRMTFEQKNDPAVPEQFICDTAGFQSARSLRLDNNNPYGAAWKKPFGELTDNDHVRIRMSADLFSAAGINPGQPLYVVLIMTGSNDHTYGYSAVAFDSTGILPGQWNHVHADVVTPVVLHSSDVVNVYAWNSGGVPVLIDNAEVILYTLKP